MKSWLVVGPERTARAYADRRGWPHRFTVFAQSSDELRIALQRPDSIGIIALVPLDELPEVIAVGIRREVEIIKVTWPEIPVIAAATPARPAALLPA